MFKADSFGGIQGARRKGFPLSRAATMQGGALQWWLRVAVAHDYARQPPPFHTEFCIVREGLHLGHVLQPRKVTSHAVGLKIPIIGEGQIVFRQICRSWCTDPGLSSPELKTQPPRPRRRSRVDCPTCRRQICWRLPSLLSMSARVRHMEARPRSGIVELSCFSALELKMVLSTISTLEGY